MGPHTSELETRSPQLAGALRRTWPGAPGARFFHLASLAFDCSIRAGALAELDFSREPGVSYNPRPARVALILLKDAGETEPVPVLAALLISAFESGGSDTGNPALDEATRAARLAMSAAAALITASRSLPDDKIVLAAAKAACANHLDRIRHLHQAPPERLNLVFHPLDREAVHILELANEISPPIAKRITHWRERVRPRLLALVRAPE